MPRTLTKKPSRKIIGKRQVPERVLDAAGEVKIHVSQASPCKQALARVKAALTAAEASRLKVELDLLEKTVSGCPESCGCRLGVKRAVIFSEARVLGELASEDGRFSGLFLNQAGEELLGEDLARMRYVGLPGVAAGESHVQVRDPGFLAAFTAWCDTRGCGVLVLTDPYIAMWSDLQYSGIEAGKILALMRKLVALPQDEAWRLCHESIACAGKKTKIC
jgi:hypothetical protein